MPISSLTCFFFKDEKQVYIVPLTLSAVVVAEKNIHEQPNVSSSLRRPCIIISYKCMY